MLCGPGFGLWSRGAWMDDNTIVFAGVQSALRRVSAGGGTPAVMDPRSPTGAIGGRGGCQMGGASWLMDLRRGTDSRLTSEAVTAPGGVSGAAEWARDGSQVAFQSNRAGLASLYRKPPSGAADDELVVSGADRGAITVVLNWPTVTKK